MKAIIKQTLVRKTCLGHSVVTEKIIGTSESIVSKVQDYITERINKKNFIPVEKLSMGCFSMRYSYRDLCLLNRYTGTHHLHVIISKDVVKRHLVYIEKL